MLGTEAPSGNTEIQGKPERSRFHDDYDSCIYFPNDPNREAAYRVGWLSEAMAAVRVANSSKSLFTLEKKLTKRETRASNLRFRASRQACQAAWKRCGRKPGKPVYTEFEQLRSRLTRGQMQSVSTILYAIKKLIALDRPPSIETVREMLEKWFNNTLEWAVCTDANDQSIAQSPEFLHESESYRWAVEQ